MSPIAIISIFLICLAAMIIAIVKFKVHATVALLLTVLLLGLLLGIGGAETIKLITTGFGNIMGSIGITIFLGVIIGVGIQETGAAESMYNFFKRLFGEGLMTLAAGLTTFIICIPVFGDVGIILMAPIAATISQKQKMSMKRLAAAIIPAQSLTHGLVPPTPGILLACVLLGADVGKVILYGLLIGMPSYLIYYFFIMPTKIVNPDEDVQPAQEYIDAALERASHALPLPNTVVSFAPIIVPVILLTAASISQAFAAESAFAQVMTFLGDRIIAMIIGVLIILAYAFIRRRVLPPLAKGATYSSTVFGDWINKAILVCAAPLLITALAGPFGSVIQATGIADMLTNAISRSPFPMIFVPFILAAILLAVGGSATLAITTSAAIILPILPGLSYSPEFVALICGIGSMLFPLPNGSMFWVSSSVYRLSPKQVFQTFSIPSLLCCTMCTVFLFFFNFIGVIA